MKVFVFRKKKGVLTVMPVNADLFADVYTLEAGEEISRKDFNKIKSCAFDGYKKAQFMLSKYRGIKTLIVR